jgi:Bacteriophage Mu Gam like protein
MEQRMRLNGLAVKEEATVEDGDQSAELSSMVPQQFDVHDRDAAEWLVRKIVEADAYIGRVKHQADREIRRTQRERDFLLMRYGPQLERWTESELQKHKGRRKSVLLLSGTVGFRQLSSKLVIDNAGLVLKWAKRNCASAVVIVEKLSKRILDDHFSRTGELPTGAHCEPSRQKFFVK